MRKSALLLILVFVVFQAGFAQAEEKKQFGTDLAVILKPLSGQEEKAFKTKLDLTEDQQARLQKVNAQYRKDVSTLTHKYQSTREELVRAIQANDPNSRDILQKLREVHQAQSNLVGREVDFWNALSGVFTPDQATTFWHMFGKSRLRGGSGGGDVMFEPAPGGGKPGAVEETAH